MRRGTNKSKISLKFAVALWAFGSSVISSNPYAFAKTLTSDGRPGCVLISIRAADVGQSWT
ncbi:hypothetical protein SAMD00023353_3500690 [Rosellinia necatrix]|uniref:Uncharacterized protein n=1 Tax=Rosellinia necatrix TaxID=77044 RepID=A0A1S8A8T7_ROSNE|nr:hypothetical protein SAMD00023353_3500690 [Rosellinia necatrix]